MQNSITTPQKVIPVNTARVRGRRRLKFQQLDDITAEVERLAAVPIRQLGNWSLPQCVGHLSRAMQMSLEGVPDRAPWLIRMTIGKVTKPLVLSKGMRPGFKLPVPVAERLVPAATVSTDEAISELRAYVVRLQTEPQRHPHPFFGSLTRNEWDRLHLRHAEMHLSFYLPE